MVCELATQTVPKDSLSDRRYRHQSVSKLEEIVCPMYVWPRNTGGGWREQMLMSLSSRRGKDADREENNVLVFQSALHH